MRPVNYANRVARMSSGPVPRPAGAKLPGSAPPAPGDGNKKGKVPDPGIAANVPLFWTDSACAAYLKQEFRSPAQRAVGTGDAVAMRKVLSELMSAYVTLKHKDCIISKMTVGTLLSLLGILKASRIARTIYTAHIEGSGEMDPTLVACAVGALAKAGDLRGVESILRDARRRGIPLSQEAGNNYLLALARADYGLDVLREQIEVLQKEGFTADLYTYNILVKACRTQRDADHVLSCIASDGLKPSLRTFQTLIRVAAHCMDEEWAVSILRMTEDMGHPNDPAIRCGMLKVYQVKGDLDKLYDYFEEMKEAGVAGAVAYKIYLSGCLNALSRGDRPLRMARQAWKSLLESNIPLNATLCTTMLRILCKKGCTEEVKEIERLMMHEGIRHTSLSNGMLRLAAAELPPELLKLNVPYTETPTNRELRTAGRRLAALAGDHRHSEVILLVDRLARKGNQLGYHDVLSHAVKEALKNLLRSRTDGPVPGEHGLNSCGRSLVIVLLALAFSRQTDNPLSLSAVAEFIPSPSDKDRIFAAQYKLPRQPSISSVIKAAQELQDTVTMRVS